MRYLFLLLLLVNIAYADGDHKHQGENNNAIAVTNDAINRNQIKLVTAGPETIIMTREVLGKIVPNADKTIYIYPRYNGMIQRLTKQLGDKVEKGDILATVESDHTLQSYKITAPFAGYIVQKNANPGEHITNNNAIYRLADLSQVWVDLFIYRKNARSIRIGQRVMVYHDQYSKQGQSSTISYVSPLGVEHNQTMLARAVLDNQSQDLIWLPGIYVDTHITIKEEKVSVAVLNHAIQSINQHPVIFVRTKQGFAAKPVKLGLKGDKYTQILSGLEAGEQYAAQQSFLLKAELEKEHATHSH